MIPVNKRESNNDSIISQFRRSYSNCTNYLMYHNALKYGHALYSIAI